MNIGCPQCQTSQTVAKVSDVYYDSIATPGKYPRLTWEERHDPLPLRLDAATRDELAVRLAPPPMPRRADSDDDLLFASIEGGSSLFADSPLGLVLGVIIGLIIGLFVMAIKALFYGGRRLIDKSTGANWETAMARWNSLYYCAQCDAVFLPGHDTAITSKRMSSLL